jgi:crotonobetainyl-CoA:carnitine CoA-transferase CaiB-like acyl-CoA transferase
MSRLALQALELPGAPAAAAGRLLADAGVSVVKLEAPGDRSVAGDDPGRRYRDTDKRSLTLDVTTDAGIEILTKLVPAFDIVVEAWPPGRMASLGLDYDRLSSVNPRLVLVSITPFGQTGPYANFVADDLVAFAMGGLMFLSGRPDLPPVVAPCEQAYMTAAVHAALGALAGTWAAEHTGRGAWVDVSMQECLAAQENTITNYRGGEIYSRRMGSQHRTAIPGRIFACRDGWVHVFITPNDKQLWQRFLDWIGRPPEISGPEFAEMRHRAEQADLVTAVTARCLQDRDRNELFRSAQALHLPVVPVYAPADVLADPHVQFLDVLDRVADGEGDYVTLRPAMQRGAPRAARSAAPAPGAHSAGVLRDVLGLEDHAIAVLRSKGIV